jgi:serine/threonine-protein kinase RsbT
MTSQTIKVEKDFDIILARSRVRDLARDVGMSTTDQARISLATSAAARAIGLGARHRGEILVESLDGVNGMGIRVVCHVHDCTQEDLATKKLNDAKMMTDELTIERSATNDVLLTMIKRAKRRGDRG